MNDPPSDVNESIIDIFVLSVSEAVTSLFTEHLEKKGYRVTLFTDGRYLLDTLREGKPNLLICDTTTLDEEGFEVCRHIKAHEDYWVIPVLILTRGASITDLLRILDCNADNFITHPFDLSFCLSIIDSLISVPVERQTPDQIKTQFKISHNDQIYVVSANRRKLLEFLLSSFEITATQSSELLRIKSELQELSESALSLEARVHEQTRTIESIHEALQQKEQKISALTLDTTENKKILDQKTGVIERLSEQLDEDKSLLASFEENLNTAQFEKKETESRLQSEIDTLRRQMAELLFEVDTTKTSLETVQGELEDEKIHGTSLECTLELLVQQKELAEKTLHTLTQEHNELKTALADEKNRVLSAGQENEILSRAKLQAEQELTTKIISLNGELKQQDADLARLKGELKAETDLRKSLETNLESLQDKKAQSELSLRSSISTLEAQLGELQEKLETTRTALETEEEKTTTLTGNLADVIADKEKTLQAITLEYDQLKSALAEEKSRAVSAEQEIQKLTDEKVTAERELNLTVTNLQETVRQQSGELTRLKNELETESTTRLAAETQAETIQKEKEQAERELNSALTALKKQVGELQEKHESVRAALETEEGRTKALKENLADIIAEKEKTEQILKTDRDSYKTTFSRLKYELDEATAIPATLERELNAVKSQNKALTDELNLAYQARAQISHQVHSLTEELEQVKALLASEQDLHRASKENHESDKQVAAGIEQELRKLSGERDSLGGILEKERSLKEAAEEKAREASRNQELAEQELRSITTERERQESERAKKLQNLEKEFELVGDLQKSLESQVNILKQEKSEAEKTILALTSELDQARTALADEWEDHMISVAAAYKERQRLQGISPLEGPVPKNEPIPETFGHQPDSIAHGDADPYARVETPSQDTGKSTVPEKMAAHTTSGTVTEVTREALTDIVQEFSDEDEEPVVARSDSLLKPADDIGTSSLDELSPAPDAGDGQGSDIVPSGDEEPEADEEGSAFEYGSTPPYESGKSISQGVFSLSRRQWFDLLKWARHSGSLSHDQRMQIVKMGRLIQKDRKLTKKQEEQVNEMIALVQSLGYRPS